MLSVYHTHKGRAGTAVSFQEDRYPVRCLRLPGACSRVSVSSELDRGQSHMPRWGPDLGGAGDLWAIQLEHHESEVLAAFRAHALGCRWLGCGFGAHTDIWIERKYV